MPDTRPLKRLLTHVFGVLRAPGGALRIGFATFYGVICRVTFAAAVLSKINAMFFAMFESLGRVPAPWSIVANIFRTLQSPLTHSVQQSKRGGQVLARFAPRALGLTPAMNTYAIPRLCGDQKPVSPR